eukprot:2040052-Rhodomonas_salina.3
MLETDGSVSRKLTGVCLGGGAATGGVGQVPAAVAGGFAEGGAAQGLRRECAAQGALPQRRRGRRHAPHQEHVSARALPAGVHTRGCERRRRAWKLGWSSVAGGWSRVGGRGWVGWRVTGVVWREQVSAVPGGAQGRGGGRAVPEAG